MLLGVYEHTMDEKGRLSLPAKLREELGESVILWLSFEKQINLYPVAAFARIAQNLDGLNYADDQVREVELMIYDNAACEIDKQGRILIPPVMRTEAGLDGAVIIQGRNDHLEIWSAPKFLAERQRIRAKGLQLANDLKPLGLKM